MFKKMIAMLTVVLLSVTVLTFGFGHDAAAKSYRSGVRSFSPSSGKTFTPSSKYNSTNKKSTFNQANKKTSSNKGGFLRGMIAGGIGGFLLGSLFHTAGLGALGSLLTFMINILFIFAIIMVIARLVSYFTNRRRENE